MNTTTISSFDELMKRKRRLEKEMAICEDEIEDKVYELTHPFATLFANGYYDDEIETCDDEVSPTIQKGYKIVTNAVRLVQIFRIGKSIYSDFKK
jgi:hypothetical protein